MAQHRHHHHRHHHHRNGKKLLNAVVIVLIVVMLDAMGCVYVYSHAKDQREQERLEQLRQQDREGRKAQKVAQQQAEPVNPGEEIPDVVGWWAPVLAGGNWNRLWDGCTEDNQSWWKLLPSCRLHHPLSGHEGLEHPMFQQAQGVLRKVVWSGSDKVTKDPHVCTYLVDGKDYRLEMRDYSLGENVGIWNGHTIWYNPAKPEETMAFHYETNKVFTTLLVLGLIFVPLELVLICVEAALSSS